MPKGLIHSPPVSPQYGLSCASVPYAVVAFRARPSLLLAYPSFRGSSYNINLGPSFLQAPIFRPTAEGPAWSSYGTAAFLARSLTKSSIARCRNSMTGRPSDGGGTPLAGPIIAFGPRLQLPAAPYGQTQVHRSVLGGFDSLLIRRSLGDFL
jgi:hypothetical protein